MSSYQFNFSNNGKNFGVKPDPQNSRFSLAQLKKSFSQFTHKSLLTPKFIIGGVLLLLMITGVSASLILNQENQDIRQQASTGPINCNTTCANGKTFSDANPYTFSSCEVWAGEACATVGSSPSSVTGGMSQPQQSSVPAQSTAPTTGKGCASVGKGCPGGTICVGGCIDDCRPSTQTANRWIDQECAGGECAKEGTVPPAGKSCCQGLRQCANGRCGKSCPLDGNPICGAVREGSNCQNGGVWKCDNSDPGGSGHCEGGSYSQPGQETATRQCDSPVGRIDHGATKQASNCGTNDCPTNQRAQWSCNNGTANKSCLTAGCSGESCDQSNIGKCNAVGDKRCGCSGGTCYWNPDTTCTSGSTCTNLTTQLNCASTPGCLWNTTSRKCEKSSTTGYPCYKVSNNLCVKEEIKGITSCPIGYYELLSTCQTHITGCYTKDDQCKSKDPRNCELSTSFSTQTACEASLHVGTTCTPYSFNTCLTNDTFRRCNSSGTGYETASCVSGKTCDLSQKKCVEPPAATVSCNNTSGLCQNKNVGESCDNRGGTCRGDGNNNCTCMVPFNQSACTGGFFSPRELGRSCANVVGTYMTDCFECQINVGQTCHMPNGCICLESVITNGQLCSAPALSQVSAPAATVSCNNSDGTCQNKQVGASCGNSGGTCHADGNNNCICMVPLTPSACAAVHGFFPRESGVDSCDNISTTAVTGCFSCQIDVGRTCYMQNGCSCLESIIDNGQLCSTPALSQVSAPAATVSCSSTSGLCQNKNVGESCGNSGGTCRGDGNNNCTCTVPFNQSTCTGGGFFSPRESGVNSCNNILETYISGCFECQINEGQTCHMPNGCTCLVEGVSTIGDGQVCSAPISTEGEILEEPASSESNQSPPTGSCQNGAAPQCIEGLQYRCEFRYYSLPLGYYWNNTGNSCGQIEPPVTSPTNPCSNYTSTDLCNDDQNCQSVDLPGQSGCFPKQEAQQMLAEAESQNDSQTVVEFVSERIDYFTNAVKEFAEDPIEYLANLFNFDVETVETQEFDIDSNCPVGSTAEDEFCYCYQSDNTRISFLPATVFQLPEYCVSTTPVEQPYTPVNSQGDGIPSGLDSGLEGGDQYQQSSNPNESCYELVRIISPELLACSYRPDLDQEYCGSIDFYWGQEYCLTAMRQYYAEREEIGAYLGVENQDCCCDPNLTNCHMGGFCADNQIASDFSLCLNCPAGTSLEGMGGGVISMNVRCGCLTASGQELSFDLNPETAGQAPSECSAPLY